MIVIKILLWIFIIPFLLGKYLEKQEDNKILYTWCLGYVMEMAVFFIVAIPMILTRAEFKALRNFYFLIILILSILSVILNREKFKNIINFKMPKISFFKVLAIFLVVLQVFIKYNFAAINNDDSSFVVLSTKMIEDGNMYHSGPNTELNSRRALAPISAYYSVLSEYLGIHVAIVTHTIMPMVFMIFGNLIYYYFGKALFNKNEDSPYIFLIFMTVLNFYYFHLIGAGAYYLKFTWFGRVIISAMLLPLLWKISLDAMNKDKNYIIDWLTILAIVLASCLGSEMALAIVSIPLIVLATIASIRNKNISYFVKSLLCVIPCVIIGIIYLKIQ